MKSNNPYLFDDVSSLDIPPHVRNVLLHYNMEKLFQVVNKNEKQLMKLRNMGKVGIEKLKEELNYRGLYLGSELGKIDILIFTYKEVDKIKNDVDRLSETIMEAIEELNRKEQKL